MLPSIGDRQIRIGFGETIEFRSGGSTTVNVPRGYLLYGLQLFLNVSATDATAANNSRAATQGGNIWGIIKRVQVIADGNNVLIDMSARDLWWYNRRFFGCVPPLPFSGTASAASGTGFGNIGTNPSGFASLVLPFVRDLRSSFNPDDTTLDSRRLNTLQLRIDWGTLADITTSASASAPVVTCNFNTLGAERRATTVADEPIRSLAQRITLSKTFSATGNNQDFDLPTGYIYTGFCVNQRNTSAADTTSGIGAMRLLAGNTQIFDYAWNRARQLGEMYYGINAPIFTSAAAAPLALEPDYLQNNYKDTSFAWSYLPTSFLGRLSESPDTFSYGDFKLRFDILTANTVVTVLCDQVTPVRQAA